jgi:hypothetical protein
MELRQELAWVLRTDLPVSWAQQEGRSRPTPHEDDSAPEVR